MRGPAANLNDRSMVGMRDSEIAVRVADTDTVATTMHGKPWQASRFAHAMRVYGRSARPWSCRRMRR